MLYQDLNNSISHSGITGINKSAEKSSKINSTPYNFFIILNVSFTTFIRFFILH